MGDLVVTEQECRFGYEGKFLQSGSHAGLSLLSDPQRFKSTPVVFTRRPGFPLHPRLMSFIPAHARNNIQRRLYEKILARRDNPPVDGFDTDWEIMLLAGRNGIGHLDIFRDDIVAQSWYQSRMPHEVAAATRSAFWRQIKDDITLEHEELDADAVSEMLGPTPSVGGMVSKLLVAIPKNEPWNGDFAASGTRVLRGVDYHDVVLKVEPAEYRGVLAMESLCLDVHEELGFEVPKRWFKLLDGLPVLAVTRFDHTESGLPLPMESMQSVWATGDRRYTGTGSTDLEDIARRLDRLATVVNLDAEKAKKEMYRRFCLAFLTGNGDLHLENLSFLGDIADVRLSPVYDPAPMRAWPQHNMRSAIPLLFRDQYTVGANLIRFGKVFGYPEAKARKLWAQMLEATENYMERLVALDGVPDARKKALIGIVEKERAIMVAEI